MMKILVSDFDYIFFDNNFEHNIKVINKFVDKGNMFIIATSRNFTSLSEDISLYHIKYSYLICKDGAMIYDKDKQVIYRKDIDSDIASDVYEMVSGNRATRETWIDNGYDYTLDTNDGCNSLIGKVRSRRKCEDLLRRVKSKYSSISGYINGSWIYIMDKTVNKARGIDYILKRNHLSSDKVYTIGLDDNDIRMIEDYQGYAVEDSSDVIKSKALDTYEDFSEVVNHIDEINN